MPIPLIVGGIVSAASAIGSAKIQSNAAKKAAQQQQQGTDRALQAQTQANQPYMDLGKAAAGRLGELAANAQPYQQQFRPGQPQNGFQPSLGAMQQPQGQPGMEMPPQGQQLPPQGQPQQQPFNLEKFQARATELSKGLKGTNQEFQQILYPQLAQEFAGLERFGSKGDKIRIPGGGVIDAVLSAGLGGKGFQFGLEGPAAPKPLMSLGNMAPVSPDLYRPPPGAPPMPMQQPEAAPQQQGPAFAPQTVQGPQGLDIKSLMAQRGIPGFADGVLNFSGGPALVGERGPELLNLPKGSDVIPMQPPAPGAPGSTIADRLNREQGPQDFGPLMSGQPASGSMDLTGPLTFGGGGNDMPALGGSMNLGGGGGIPAIGQTGGGAINFGGGGGMPAIGNPQGPMTLGGGGGLPPIGQPAGGAQQPQGGPQMDANGQFQYNAFNAPQAYNPAAVGGPERLTLGSINRPGAVNAQQVGPGQQVQAGTVQPGANVGFDRVQGQNIDAPQQVGFERVQGPQALQAQQLGPAAQQANLSADQLQMDPSYQFRRDETLRALENSAFSKGMGFHPNAIRGLQETAGNLASQEYAAANARNLGVQQQNFQNTATVAGANNAANAQAYGLSEGLKQQAALANQGAGIQTGMFNSQQGQQAQQFNAGQNQQANLANQQAGMQTGMFNSGQQQQAGMFNAGNQQQAQQFNSAQGQQSALANQGANLQAGQFNANQDFQTQQANIGNQLAAYNAYAPLAQQNSQFNAGRQDAANQNNFANSFGVNQANNAGALGAFNANLNSELGRGNLGVSQGQLALGNRSADQSYDLGLRANALGNRTADQNYGLGLGQLGISQGNLDLAGQGQQFNQDLSTFNTNYGVYQNNNNTAFNQNLALTQLGQGAAQNYGNQAGNYYSGQGNANGAAAINQGNAYAGALGNIGNLAGQAAVNWPQGQPQGYGPAGQPPSPYGYG